MYRFHMQSSVTAVLGVSRMLKYSHTPVLYLLELLCDEEIHPLQTVQIMVGLFNIGLGPGRTSTHSGDLTGLGAAYWLGAVVKKNKK